MSFLADPAQVPPIPLCDGPGDCRWLRLGGTSAPAPAFAAGLALVDQVLATGGGSGRIGPANPLIASVGRAGGDGVHDVTRCDNRVAGTTCCDAAEGYDLASGWGSIRLPALVTAVGDV